MSFRKSIEMLEKTTIAIGKPIQIFLVKKGSKNDSYEDILIEVVPGLKEYLLEKRYIDIKK